MLILRPLFSKQAIVEEGIKEKVIDTFTKYLEKNGHRKTPERYAVLDEIYSHHGHFDTDELYELLNKKKAHISRSTIYSTLDLLIDSKLVQKHPIGKSARYEMSFRNSHHGHLICTKCGNIQDFCDERLLEVKDNISQKENFQADYLSVYMYGTCANCLKNK